MNKAQSLWSKADKFLTLTRKILLNTFTAIVLVVITFSILGGVGSFFAEEDKINTEDKILWFKPVGVVVDNSINSPSSIDALLLGSTDTKQHKLEDLLEVLSNAANDEDLAAVYITVTELGM